MRKHLGGLGRLTGDLFLVILCLALGGWASGALHAPGAALADYNVPVQGGPWQLTVLSVRQATQLSVQGQPVSPAPGEVFVIVEATFQNLDPANAGLISTPNVWLVTQDSGFTEHGEGYGVNGQLQCVLCAINDSVAPGASKTVDIVFGVKPSDLADAYLFEYVGALDDLLNPPSVPFRLSQSPPSSAGAASAAALAPNSSTPQGLVQTLLATLFTNGEIPGGPNPPQIAQGTVNAGDQSFNAVGEVDVTVQGPDDDDEVDYVVFDSAADAQADYNVGPTAPPDGMVTSQHDVQGYQYPSYSYDVSVGGAEPQRSSVCVVLVQNVLVIGYSVINSPGIGASVDTACGLAQGGVVHLNRLLGP